MTAPGLLADGGCADPVVQCTDLTVSRGGAEVLSAVDLQARRGEWLAVVGPNGAGKTTFLHALAGLVPATGRVLVAGLDPRSGRRRVARVVALMPQRPVVPDGVSVTELVGLGRTPHLRRFAGESGHDRAVVRKVLHRLDLGAFADRDAADLSGGELQRVVLARALAQEPQVLLLDEPTSALDVGHQQSVLDLVDDLRRQDGTTVVAAMHDLTLAGQYADRTVLLRAGRVVADGPPAAVLTSQRLRDVYGARVDVLALPSGPAVVPVRGPVTSAPLRPSRAAPTPIPTPTPTIDSFGGTP